MLSQRKTVTSPLPAWSSLQLHTRGKRKPNTGGVHRTARGYAVGLMFEHAKKRGERGGLLLMCCDASFAADAGKQCGFRDTENIAFNRKRTGFRRFKARNLRTVG